MQRTIIAQKDGVAGRIRLNRPHARNALTHEMCDSMIAALSAWKNDDSVKLVMIDHVDGTLGFCSGGDMEVLSHPGEKGRIHAQMLFAREYCLNEIISSFPKPCVTFLDGRVMGCGVGLAKASTHQVATERTELSMPETGIGLFPNAGATWFLPKLGSEIGTWLALTGARVIGEDTKAIGLSSHYCATSQLTELKLALAKTGIDVLSDFDNSSAFSEAQHTREMEQTFAGSCAVQIVNKLNRGSRWAKAQATKISAKSPISVKIALRQLRTGVYLGSISDALRIEYRIASRILSTSDFREGVRAKIIEKDHNPRWSQDRLQSVSFDMVAKFFSPMPNEEWSPG